MAVPTLTPEEISEILAQFFDVVGKRQYVGARYVPIFGRRDETSIAWDNSAPYEPLTIVLYQGNSYTSRQYVPAGVEITNTDYWANTGNYNAQVEQYRNEVSTLSDAFGELSQKLDGRAIAFETVADMTAEQSLKVGDVCITQGFRTAGDNGGGLYAIVSETPNGFNAILCDNGLVAKLQTRDEVCPEQLGAYGDGTNDDTDYVQFALSNYHTVNLYGRYFVSQPLSMIENQTIMAKSNYARLTCSLLSGYLLSTEYTHFKLDGILFWCTVDGVNNAGGFYAARPYDECSMRNCTFVNFYKESIFIGVDNTAISQSMVIENILCYTTREFASTYPIVRLNRCYEFNISNSKFLARNSENTTPNMILDKCWDAYIRGCSFISYDAPAISCINGFRYGRIIGNTFEHVAGSSENGCFVEFGSADETVSSSVTYTTNTIIANNYYNSSEKVGIFHRYYNTNNVFIGCYCTDGQDNIVIYPKEYSVFDGANRVSGLCCGEDGRGLVNNGPDFVIARELALDHSIRFREAGTETEPTFSVSRRYTDGTHKYIVRTKKENEMIVGNGTERSYVDLYSANGTLYRITVLDDGTLTTAAN